MGQGGVRGGEGEGERIERERKWVRKIEREEE